MHVGLIGTGNISRTHALAVSAAGLTVSAVVGRTAGSARQFCEAHGGTPYDDLETFLAHRPLDLVVIGTPSGQHALQGVAAASRGLHVLVEKPIDILEDRVDALIAAADVSGVQVGVCYQDRFAAGSCTLKDLIDRGALGRLLTIDARLPWYRPPSYYTSSAWRGTWELDGGGALMNQGIHTVDLLLWLMGDVAEVVGHVATLRHDIAVEDTAHALLTFRNGAHGTLSATTAMFPGYPRRMVIAGTAGTVTLERDTIVAADFDGPPPEGLVVEAPLPDDGRASSPLVSDCAGHRAVVEDFVRAIRSGGRPRCDARDGRRSVALVRAIYASSSSGRPVAPSRRADDLSGVS